MQRRSRRSLLLVFSVPLFSWILVRLRIFFSSLLYNHLLDMVLLVQFFVGGYNWMTTSFLVLICSSFF
jgi:hypothetical protein